MARNEVTGRKSAGRDPSVNGFCRRKNISRSTWNNWQKRGLTPKFRQPVAGGKIFISLEAEEAWDRESTVSDDSTGEAA